MAILPSASKASMLQRSMKIRSCLICPQVGASVTQGKASLKLTSPLFVRSIVNVCFPASYLIVTCSPFVFDSTISVRLFVSTTISQASVGFFTLLPRSASISFEGTTLT